MYLIKPEDGDLLTSAPTETMERILANGRRKSFGHRLIRVLIRQWYQNDTVDIVLTADIATADIARHIFQVRYCNVSIITSKFKPHVFYPLASDVNSMKMTI